MTEYKKWQKSWRTREDSNLWPLPSEGATPYHNGRKSAILSINTPFHRACSTVVTLSRPVAMAQPFGATMQVKLPLTLITLFRAFQPHSSENNVAGQGSARDMEKTL